MTIQDQRCCQVLIAALLAAGCGEGHDDRISEIDRLRILAVRAEEPFVAPGGATTLQMLVADGSPRAMRADGTWRPVSTVWLPPCLNPPGDLYYECLPRLNAELGALTDAEFEEEVTLLNSPTESPPPLALEVPSDIISARPTAAGVVSPYGTLFQFYAACAGELRVVRGPEVSQDMPLRCVDPETGRDLPASDLEFGYYPLYAYAELRNQNPVIESVRLGDETSSRECADEGDCPENQVCGSTGTCLPRLASCRTDEDCAELWFGPEVTEASVEVSVSAYLDQRSAPPETLWVSYYTDYGEFDKEARIISDPASGFRSDTLGLYRPRFDERFLPVPREVRLVAVVRDSRGGVSWVERRVWVD